MLGAVTHRVGFALSTPNVPLGPNRTLVRASGRRWVIGYADPVANIGFGYVMNQMGASVRSIRA